MPTTTEGRIKAARAILRMTGLGDHVIVRQHIRIDESHTEWDWDALIEEPLSTGERITIEVMRTILLGHGHATIADLYALDDEYRRVCIDALRLALIGDEVPML